MTPLHIAAIHNRFDLCLVLINQKLLNSDKFYIDLLKAKDHNGKTALEHASVASCPVEDTSSRGTRPQHKPGNVFTYLFELNPLVYGTELLECRLKEAVKADNDVIVRLLLAELHLRKDHTLPSLYSSAVIQTAVEKRQHKILNILLGHMHSSVIKPNPILTDGDGKPHYRSPRAKILENARFLRTEVEVGQYYKKCVHPCLVHALKHNHADIVDALMRHFDAVFPYQFDNMSELRRYFDRCLVGSKYIAYNQIDLIVALLRHFDRLALFRNATTPDVFNLYIHVIQEAAAYKRVKLMRRVFELKDFTWWHGDAVRNGLFKHSIFTDPGFVISQVFKSVFAKKIKIIPAVECFFCCRPFYADTKVAISPCCMNISCALCSAKDIYNKVAEVNARADKAITLSQNPEQRMIRCIVCNTVGKMRHDCFALGDLTHSSTDIYEGDSAALLKKKATAGCEPTNHSLLFDCDEIEIDVDVNVEQVESSFDADAYVQELEDDNALDVEQYWTLIEQAVQDGFNGSNINA